MYKIGIKHNGVIIATTELSEEEDKRLEVSMFTFIVELFQKKFGLDIIRLTNAPPINLNSPSLLHCEQ